MKERIQMHYDSQDGLVAVRVNDADACWHWICMAILIGALSGIALCIGIINHANNPPSSTPTVEEVRHGR